MTDHTNETRAAIAAGLIDTFKDKTNADQCDALADLLADLMHYADAYGFDFDNELRRARNNYDAEIEEVKP
jgi:hypothetical protein